MNTQQLQGILNFLPQTMKNNARSALDKALQMIDPTTVKTESDLRAAVQRLGIPNTVISSALDKLNNPLANTLIGLTGFNKQDFQNGLQSIKQLDNSSAVTSNGIIPSSNSPLLQGIDQLK